MRNHSDFAPETLNAQALRQIDAATGGLTPAIFPSTTYVRDENYALLDPQHSYGRDENPGFVVAEQVLARLEGGEAASALQFRHVRCHGDHPVPEARRPGGGAQDHVLGIA